MLTAIRKFRRKLLFIHHDRYKEKSKRRGRKYTIRSAASDTKHSAMSSIQLISAPGTEAYQ